MITPIEVIDSAVKIGLGAAISGVAAYWLAKANHRKEIEKRQSQRKCELMEGVAQQVAIFDQSVVSFLRVSGDWLDLPHSNTAMSPETLERLTGLDYDHDVCAKDLKSAEAKLLLLGEAKCQMLLRAYMEEARLPYVESVAERRVTGDSLTKRLEDIRQEREAFFNELSDAYKRL